MKKPCPFCSNTELEVLLMDDDSRYACVWCSRCKSTGPIVDTCDLEPNEDYEATKEQKDMAFAAWDNRVVVK